MLEQEMKESHALANEAGQKVDLAAAIFSPEAAWQAVCVQNPICDQLKVEMTSLQDARLVWTSLAGTRPNASQPTRIELQIPAGILQSQSAWEFKADMLTNLAAGNSDSAPEPMRTPFFSTLMDKGFEIVSIANASLSDAALQMRFSRTASLSNVKMQAEGCIRCEKLALQQVEIVDSKLSIYTETGSWTGVLVKGATELSGSLGKTAIDGQCVFHGTVVKADCREADFGPNLGSRLLGGLYTSELMPPPVKALLQPADEAYLRKLYGALEGLTHQPVQGEWENSVDLSRGTNGGSSGSVAGSPATIARPK